jgi:Mg2+ and Co2+ transporter CorA
MKIPKKFIAGTFTAINAVAPVVTDVVSEKLKQKSEREEQERIYVNQRRNGMVKNASILFSLISLALAIIAIKQSKIVLSIVGLLALVTYVITFLYCLEIIDEKKHNTYRIIFIIGDMLLVTIVTLLFF